MVGITDVVLKQESFRQCDSLVSVDNLRDFCCIWEVAKSDVVRPRERTTGVMATSDDVMSDEPTPVAATLRARPSPSNWCYYCCTAVETSIDMTGVLCV